MGTIDQLKKHVIFKAFLICCLILFFSYILVIDSISAEEDNYDQEKFDFHVKFIESIRNREDVELIKGYLEKGADPNLNNYGYGPALWTAAWANSDPEIVKLLLDYGAKADISDLGLFMVFECNLDNIRLLLKNGVDVNKEIRDSIFGPYISLDKYFVEEASKENKLQVDLFRTLGNSPLVMAVEAGRIELAELLIEFGADPDLSTGSYKNTSLRAAALNNQHFELVRILLRAGADPGLADSDGYTPLMAAAESGNLEAAQLLLIYGAELNAQSALKMSPLKGAVLSKNYELVSYFIEEGADLEMTYNSGMNILHLAAANSSPEIVGLLLEKGLDPLSTDNEKRTPYHLALINDNHSVLNKLKEYGGEKIIASFLSEYLQEKDLTAEGSLHYKFSKDGEKLLTIDNDGEREHIRVWHKYKDDYFLTRLDYKFRVAEGKSSYTIYRNLYLSPYGNMIVIYDAENNRIYLDGLSMDFYERTNFEEAAEADFVTLSLVYNDDAYQEIVAVYKRDGSLYLKKWDIVRGKNYIYLTDRGEEEYQLDIDDDLIIDSFGLSYQLVPWDKINASLSTVFGESQTVNIRGKKSLDFEIKLAYSEDSSRAYSYKLVPEGKKVFENLLSYSGSTYSEYSIETAAATIEFLNEVNLDANIIAASFDYADNKWILLTDKGLIKRDIMSREEAAIKSILSGTSGLLEAGFKKQWLEKTREAMKIDPSYEYFQNSLYMNMAAKGFEVKDIGELLLLNYNLLMKEDGPAKEQMITRLIQYALFAERAGQRALVKQAAQKINSLSAVEGFEDYQREIDVASVVLESIYMLVGDNPEQAYDYLLENKVMELGQESRLLLKEKIVKNPALWQSLFIDKNKIAYLLGIEKEKIPQQLKYNETVSLPYPDLEGNIIEGINEHISADNNTESSETGTIVSSGQTIAGKSPEMVLVEIGTTSKNNTENFYISKLKNDFYISKYEVTQAEYEEIMGFNPSHFIEENHPDLTGDSNNRPVENISWFDAIMYCNKLSEEEGLDKYYNISDIKYSENSIKNARVTENEGANGYRLPTAHEWGYAGYGGSSGEQTRFAGSNDNPGEVAWHRNNSGEANSNQSKNKGTMPVGLKKPNELGLYDMTGNVDEWTNSSDSSKKLIRIIRGGNWSLPPDFIQVHTVFKNDVFSNEKTTGFRICRTKSEKDDMNTTNSNNGNSKTVGTVLD